MRNLSLDQLKALETVIGLGSFTAAARRLDLSQPAISRQVGELEQRLGVRLVERLGKKAFATAAGQEVIGHARRIAAEAEAAAATMRRHRDGHLGRVRLGTLPSILNYLLLPNARAFRDKHPDIDLILRTGMTPELIALLADNQIDLALGTLPVNDRLIDVHALRSDPQVALLPLGWDAPDTITPEYMMRRTLILDGLSRTDTLVREWLRAAGHEPRPAMEISYIEGIKNVVAAGLGMSVLPSFTLRAEIAAATLIVRPLDPPIERTMVLLQHRHKRDDPALRIVRDSLMALRQEPRPA
jgi:DNA-binding transcriptional LysR family regulator